MAPALFGFLQKGKWQINAYEVDCPYGRSWGGGRGGKSFALLRLESEDEKGMKKWLGRGETGMWRGEGKGSKGCKFFAVTNDEMIIPLPSKTVRLVSPRWKDSDVTLYRPRSGLQASRETWTNLHDASSIIQLLCRSRRKGIGIVQSKPGMTLKPLVRMVVPSRKRGKALHFSSSKRSEFSSS
nr:hypothetical protein Iba_chr06fCG1990 [Ipomoea batatas]